MLIAAVPAALAARVPVEDAVTGVVQPVILGQADGDPEPSAEQCKAGQRDPEDGVRKKVHGGDSHLTGPVCHGEGAKL